MRTRSREGHSGSKPSRDAGSGRGGVGVIWRQESTGGLLHQLEVGVGNDQRSIMGDTDFVLGKFSKDEQATLEKIIIPKSLEIIHEFIADNHTVTSHKLTD